jgi:uncharacterized coiled-coil protein SlyX
MEPTHERIATLEHVVKELYAQQSKLERQLHRWRGLAGVLVVGSLLLQPLRVGKAASSRELGLAAQMTALEQVLYYRPPRVRRVAPRTTPTLSVRVAELERAVNYQENQIATLGAALNQEIATRQATDPRFQPPAQEFGRAQPPPPAASSPFTDAQTTTLRRLAGLLVVSGGTIRCNGDLALTLGHPLLTNKVAPVDAEARADDHGTIEFSGSTRCNGDLALTLGHTLLANKVAPIDGAGRPDDHGTTEFSGNVSVAKKLSSSATARADPQ